MRLADRLKRFRNRLARVGASAAALFFAATVVSFAAEPVLVGLAGPMVGTSFSVGRQYQVGVTAAWEATGGKALGLPVEIQAVDDACTEKLADSVARKLVESRSAVIIGHSCSAATLAAAPIYAEAGILQITPASTNPKVTEMGISTIFRMIGRDDRQGVIAAEYLAAQFPGGRIGVLHAVNAYGRGLGEVATRELRRLGVEPAFIGTFEGSQDSYLPLVDHLHTLRLDALYLLGGALDSAVLLRQLRQTGATFPVVAGDTLVSEVFGQTAGPFAEGVRFTFPPEPAALPTAAGAAAAIRAKGVDPVGYTLLAYAAYEVWLHGVTRAGGFDGAAVAAALRQGPVDTILGPVGFDAKGDIKGAGDTFVWNQWRDGKRVRTTD